MPNLIPPCEIIAKDGDTLDALCWKYYDLERAVPEVLAANTHLARAPAELAAGTRVCVNQHLNGATWVQLMSLRFMV